jgi:hypothetical protein
MHGTYDIPPLSIFVNIHAIRPVVNIFVYKAKKSHKIMNT